LKTGFLSCCAVWTKIIRSEAKVFVAIVLSSINAVQKKINKILTTFFPLALPWMNFIKPRGLHDNMLFCPRLPPSLKLLDHRPSSQVKKTIKRRK
jgi:hypothetical protein